MLEGDKTDVGRLIDVDAADVLRLNARFEDQLGADGHDLGDRFARRDDRARRRKLQIEDLAARRRDDHLPLRRVRALAQLLLEVEDTCGAGTELVARSAAVLTL